MVWYLVILVAVEAVVIGLYLIAAKRNGPAPRVRLPALASRRPFRARSLAVLENRLLCKGCGQLLAKASHTKPAI